MSSVKEKLHDLVDRFDDERAVEALQLLGDLAAIADDGIVSEPAAKRKAHQPLVVSGADFVARSLPDWPTLAAEQGVQPIENIDDLRGDFWPEDETADEFVAAVREWRREGGRG